MSNDDFVNIVQAFILTPRPSALRLCKSEFYIQEASYHYDCTKTLKEIVYCQKKKACKVFHYLEPDHFAFNSLLYDGASKILILIKTTTNPEAGCPYDQLYGFITTKPEESNKYHEFFNNLVNSGLVDRFVFQWMTDGKYEDIMENSAKFMENKMVNKKFFRIENYSEDLLDALLGKQYL